MTTHPRIKDRPAVLAPVALLAMGLALAACQPTVKVEAPDKPIRIDLNVKIEQDVRIRLENSVEHIHEENPGIF
jgi:hypothetical protein